MHFPEQALIVMVGAAGSGKSTVAKAFPASWRLELDALRATASGSPGDQSATPVAVSVFRTMLDARLERRLPVLVDSTSLMIARVQASWEALVERVASGVGTRSGALGRSS